MRKANMLGTGTELGAHDGGLIYVGPDVCFRTAVIRCAGYQLQTCASVDQFGNVLGPETAAVVMSDLEPSFITRLVKITRERSSASTILFQHASAQIPVTDLDLVIPPATPPERWLSQLASLIEQTRVLRIQSAQLRASAGALRAQSGELRKRSVAERQRTIELSKPMNDPWARLFNDEE